MQSPSIWTSLDLTYSRLATEDLDQIRSSEGDQNGAGDDKISRSPLPPGAEPFPQALLSPMGGISAGLSLPLGLSMAASSALGESIASPIPEGTTRRQRPVLLRPSRGTCVGE